MTVVGFRLVDLVRDPPVDMSVSTLDVAFEAEVIVPDCHPFRQGNNLPLLPHGYQEVCAWENGTTVPESLTPGRSKVFDRDVEVLPDGVSVLSDMSSPIDG